MQRRKFLVLIGGPHVIMSGAPALADSSGPQLASYYDRHMALLDGVAHGWTDRGQPVRLRGVGRRGREPACIFRLAGRRPALQLERGARDGQPVDDGRRLLRQRPVGVVRHRPCAGPVARRRQAAGATAHPQDGDPTPASATVPTTLHIRSDGTLWVKGLAHDNTATGGSPPRPTSSAPQVMRLR